MNRMWTGARAGTRPGGRRTAGAALLLALLVGSSCSGSDDEDVSETVQGAEGDEELNVEQDEDQDDEQVEEREEPSPDDLDNALLILDDMPTGWTTAPELLEDGEEEDEGECAFDQDLGEENEVEVAFKEGDTGPFVLHVIGTFDDVDAAEAFMDDFAEYVERCRSSEEDGVTTKIDPLSFPDVAEEAQSYRLTIEDPETPPAEVNVVLFRQDERASLVAVFSFFGSPDAQLTEDLVLVAAARL